MRWLVLVSAFALANPAVAQEGVDASSATIEEGFVEAALEVCLSTILGGAAVAASADAQARLRAASAETRAGHPFGGDEPFWELASRTDGKVTVRARDIRTCSVFAVGAPPAQSFEALAQAISQHGEFEELEIRRREEGRVQRTFRSADRRVRVELEGFIGDAPENNLSMAHVGRRR